MGKRIFVHCHAGTGRTGLVIACYLFYSGMAESGLDAISKVRTQRPGSLGKKTQRKFVVDFSLWLTDKRKSFFPKAVLPTASFGKVATPVTYGQMMQENLKLVHGSDFNEFRYYPKFLGTCLNNLLALTEEKPTVDDFLACY